MFTLAFFPYLQIYAFDLLLYLYTGRFDRDKQTNVYIKVNGNEIPRANTSVDNYKALPASPSVCS